MGENETAVSYLKEVLQWGETGIRGINLEYFRDLTKIAEPTEKSFELLEYVNFSETAITSIPEKMFMNCTKITSFEDAFYGCSNLTTIGDYAFANCSNVTSFEGVFAGIDNLTTIGEHIFEGCDNVESYAGTFYNCFNLTGKAPELWLKVPNGKENNYIGIPDGESCFGGCEKLDNYDDIPEYWSKIQGE